MQIKRKLQCKKTVATLRTEDEQKSQKEYYQSLGEIDAAIPRTVWLDSKTNDIEKMQYRIRCNEIDNNQFNQFLESDWGRAMLKDLLKV